MALMIYKVQQVLLLIMLLLLEEEKSQYEHTDAFNQHKPVKSVSMTIFQMDVDTPDENHTKKIICSSLGLQAALMGT